MKRFLISMVLILGGTTFLQAETVGDSCDIIQCKSGFGVVIGFSQSLALSPESFLVEPWCRSESYIMRSKTSSQEVKEITSDMRGIFQYSIESSSGASCDGELNVNVRMCGELFQPNLANRRIDLHCFDEYAIDVLDPPFPDSVIVIDESTIGNWSPCEVINYSTFEYVQSEPCTSPYQMIIFRHWTFQNADVTHRMVDSIYISKGSVDDREPLVNYNDVDEDAISCDSSHFFVNGVPDPELFGKPFSSNGCKNLMAAFNDEVFIIVDHPCQVFKKILRKWDIIDWCTGTIIKEQQLLWIKCGDDMSRPVARCHQEVRLMLNAQNRATLRVEDVDNLSSDDCQIAHRFFDGDATKTRLEFNGVISQGSVAVNFHVIDFAGNEDICQVNVTILPFSGADGNVGGKFYNYKLEEISTIPVELYDANIRVNNSSGFQGVQFCGIPSAYPNLDYSLCLDESSFAGPYSLNMSIDQNNTIFLNGISTKDLVLLMQHLVKKNPDSKFHDVAGDVNDDSKTNVVDVTHLRRIIIGTEQFQGDVWKFYLPDTNDIRPLDQRTFTTLPDFTQDIVPVRIGDLNHPSLTGYAPDLVTRGGDLSIFADDQFVRQGQTIQIQLQTQDSFEGVGFQLGMNFQMGAFEILQIESSPFGSEGYWSAFDDQWRYVYVDPQLNAFDVKGDLLSLTIRVNQDGLLSELFDLNDSPFDLILVEEDFQVSELEVKFAAATGTSNFQEDGKLIAYPNPFYETVRINLSDLDEKEGVFEVYNIEGQLVLRKKWNNSHQSIEIGRDELPSKGIYTGLTGRSSVRFVLIN